MRTSGEGCRRPMADPRRIQRRRARGWRMPLDAVAIDRSTRWGNPFVVGRDGTQAECVELYRSLLAGRICLSCKAEPEAQDAALRHFVVNWPALRGKRLACWCREGTACHGDVLLQAVEILAAGPIEAGPD